MIVDFHTHHTTARGAISPRSFGIHPWHSHRWLQGLGGDPREALLREMPADLEVVGECGLDKCCDAPWESQMLVFELQLQEAERRGLPVVVHCVRAFNELMQLRRRHGATPWVVHGFVGAPQLARQLCDHGIGVSFGAALLDDRRDKVRLSLRSRLASDGTLLPLTFLETDEAPASIDDVYRAAAQILGIDLAALSDAIKKNYHTLLST